MKNLVGLIIIAVCGGVGYLIAGEDGWWGLAVGFIIAAIVRRFID